MNNYSLEGKKIAILAGRDPAMRHDTDGGSVYLEYLVETLAKHNAQITVYIPSGIKGGIYIKGRSEIQKQHTGVWNSSNVTLYYFPIEKDTENTILNKEDYFFLRKNKSKKIASFFSDKKLYTYDTIYILHMANAFGITAQKLTPPEKTVLFPMMTSTEYEKFTKVPKEYIEAEKDTLEYVHHICSPSDDEIQTIIQRFQIETKKLFKIPRGFSPDDFPYKKHTITKNKKNIKLFSANGIRPQKDHLFFIPLIKELKGLGINAHVHLTGNNGKSHSAIYNAYTDTFWNTVKKEGLCTHFTAHDVLSRADMIRVMHSCDYAVYPSISETFGKSALESAVSGVPTIVLNDVPAFQEFIIHNQTGIICNRDAQECANRIMTTTNTPNLYEQISINGKLLRDSFTWDTVMKSFIKQGVRRHLFS